MKHRADLDRDVALELGIPLKMVSAITKEFLQHLSYALANEGAVSLRGFATLSTNVRVGHAGKAKACYPDGRMDKIYVRFNKKPLLKRILLSAHKERRTMEKYGVTESLTVPESLEKSASKTGKCPQCGSDLEQHGQVLKCPQCGTEPFEGGK